MFKKKQEKKCNCYKEFIPGMAIPVKSIKSMICSKCGGKITINA